MTNNKRFPKPPVSMKDFGAHIDAAVTADQQVKAGVKGAATICKQALEVVRLDLVHLAAYVQLIADQTPDQAVEIIQSSGFDVAKSTAHAGVEWGVKRGLTMGTGKMRAPSAGRGAIYQWEANEDGTTNRIVVTTRVCRADVSGLTPGKTYNCRYKVQLNGLWGDYSNIFVYIAT